MLFQIIIVLFTKIKFMVHSDILNRCPMSQIFVNTEAILSTLEIKNI